MKNKYLFTFFVFSILVFSCKHRVHLTVKEPAVVFLEEKYVSVGIINRSYSSGASKVIDVLENVLTLEGRLDHNGSKQAVQGVFDQLTVNERFEFVTLLDSMTAKNGGIDVFPAQLPWAEVNGICKREGVQLLFVLELFDTDTRIEYSTQTVNKSTPLGNIPLLQHTAKMITSVKTGWRIYDPANKFVRDEYFLSDRIVSKGTGITPVNALATLMKRGEYVKQLSQQIGSFYAGRIEDQYFRVSRNYFKSGSQKLKMAKRRSEVGDWDGAAELWLEDTKSNKRKVAGRACYNMGIYEEINGDVYKAFEWAQKSYSDYKIKEALTYSNILRKIIRRIELNKQLIESGKD
jgi:hypothetical protein